MIIPTDFKNKQGVYLITQPDGKFYIGSSIDLYGRFRQHKTYFNPGTKYYKTINYNCNWHDLEVQILKETVGLSSKELKKIETNYLKKYWSENILNIEKKASGRDISDEKNPNWQEKKYKINFCHCGVEIYRDSQFCYSCAAKNRHKNGFVDHNKRFIKQKLNK
jgi:predicted GIY-YIG superfamily endonuclease